MALSVARMSATPHGAFLRTLMSNGVARRMNFAGRGSKTGIADLKILDVVIGR